ncbi:branched-chain amino acid ABC transporter permease [Celeribacter sp. ULVN23_4]
MQSYLDAVLLLTNYLLVPGLAYGCQLALGALGVTLVFAILRFSNFAHGELMSFGAMLAIFVTWAFQAAGISFGAVPTALVALPFAMVGTVLAALFTDRSVYRFYREKRSDPVILMITSIGVMFLMAGIIRFIIGPDDRVFSDGARFLLKARSFKETWGTSEGLTIKTSQAITVSVTLIAGLLLFWFLDKTKTGKMMRAYSDNEDLALLSGINPEKIVKYTWAIAAILATLAGTLYGLDKSYKPFVYQQILLPIFAAAIVGGLGNPLGAVAGGFLIAFSEVSLTYAYTKFLGYTLPNDWVPEGLVQFLPTDYKFAISFVILVLVLLYRPTGLFREKTK